MHRTVCHDGSHRDRQLAVSRTKAADTPIPIYGKERASNGRLESQMGSNRRAVRSVSGPKGASNDDTEDTNVNTMSLNERDRRGGRRANRAGGETSSIRVLNVVIATPKDRAGAVRAGLQQGHQLSDWVRIDTVKMAGENDQELISELDLDIPVKTLPSKTAVRDGIRRLRPQWKRHANAFIWTRLKPPAPIEEYDIVHIHNAVPLAGMASVAVQCKRAGIPYCITTHGISKIPDIPTSLSLSPLERRAFELAFLKPYYAVLRNASHLFALSNRDEATLRERFPDQSISVTPNGVELNPPADGVAEEIESETGISASKPLLLFVGVLMASKGVDELLATFDRLNRDCTLVVAGPPNENHYVDRLEAYDNAEVRYLGYAPGPLLKKLYQRSDVFLFPTRADVLPLVVLEAMAAETPVVSTTVGGIPEQVTDDTGVLVPPGDVDGLVDGVESLLADETRRRDAGRRAFERVKDRFSWDANCARIVRGYRRVLRQS